MTCFREKYKGPFGGIRIPALDNFTPFIEMYGYRVPK
jgi:hypothetical protein